MRTLMNIVILFVYITLLIVSIMLIMDLYLCDNNDNTIIHRYNEKNEKAKAIYVINRFYDDGMWPFAYLGSSILIALIFIILPIKRNPRYITMAFLISFLSFYAIMSFIIHHYINPVKKYILNYIK